MKKRREISHCMLYYSVYCTVHVLKTSTLRMDFTQEIQDVVQVRPNQLLTCAMFITKQQRNVFPINAHLVSCKLPGPPPSSLTLMKYFFILRNCSMRWIAFQMKTEPFVSVLWRRFVSNAFLNRRDLLQLLYKVFWISFWSHSLKYFLIQWRSAGNCLLDFLRSKLVNIYFIWAHFWYQLVKGLVAVLDVPEFPSEHYAM